MVRLSGITCVLFRESLAGVLMKTAFLIPLTAIIGLCALALVSTPGHSVVMADAKDSSRRIETGQVTWLRNLDEAEKLSASAEKPILMLFQEIPG